MSLIDNVFFYHNSCFDIVLCNFFPRWFPMQNLFGTNSKKVEEEEEEEERWTRSARRDIQSMLQVAGVCSVTRTNVFFEKSPKFSGTKWNGKSQEYTKRNFLTADLFALQIQWRTKFVNRRSVPRGFVYLGEQFLIFCYNSVNSIGAERKGLRRGAFIPRGNFREKGSPID